MWVWFIALYIQKYNSYHLQFLVPLFSQPQNCVIILFIFLPHLVDQILDFPTQHILFSLFQIEYLCTEIVAHNVIIARLAS